MLAVLIGGSEFERVFYAVTGRNIYHPLIEYALTGKISEQDYHFSYDDIYLEGKTAAQVFPTLRAGRITAVEGLEEIRKHPKVVCVFTRYGTGDVIEETHNVNQRFAEIYIVCRNNSEMQEIIEWVLGTLKIYDENHENMLVSPYDTSIFANRIKVFGK